MKKIFTSLLILICSTYVPSFGFTVTESIKVLKKYSASDLETSKNRSKKQVGEKVQEMLSTIHETVELVRVDAKNSSPELIRELVRVSSLTLKADPSEAAAEIILPLYNEQKKAFEKALEELPTKDRANFKESLKNAAREAAEGNG